MVKPGDLDRGELIRIGADVVTIGGVASGAALFAGACVISVLIGNLFKRIRGRGVHDVSSVYMLEKILTYGLVIIGAVAGLSTAGLNLSSFSLFAGAIGLGVGLGLQGVVKEFVSGLILVFDPTVSVGDYVEVENGARGIIVEIGPRATRLRTNDNINILIPNSHLIERPLLNTTLRGDTRRIHIPFRVEPGADRYRVRDVVLKAVRASPFTLPETDARRSQVWLISYNEESVNFELVVWPTPDAVKRPASMHAAYLWTIVDALEGAGVPLPSPQIDVRLRPGDADPAVEKGGRGADAQRRRVRRPETANDAAEDVMAPEDPDLVQAEAHVARPSLPDAAPATRALPTP